MAMATTKIMPDMLHTSAKGSGGDNDHSKNSTIPVNQAGRSTGKMITETSAGHGVARGLVSDTQCDVLVRASPWKERIERLTLVTQRLEIPRSSFCGLYDYKEVCYRLTVDDDAVAIRVSPGQTLVYSLADPKGVIQGSTAEWEIQPKITKTVTWEANRRSKVIPLRKHWDMPSLALKQALSTEGRFVVPSFLPNAYNCKLIKIEIDLIFSLIVNKSLGGSSPPLKLCVRG